MEEAREQYERALAIQREVGDRRCEGAVLGSLGSLCAQAGASGEARATLAAGERRLREVGDTYELGKILCARGEMEADSADLAATRASLEETGNFAADTGAGPESQLGRAVSKLRESLATNACGL